MANTNQRTDGWVFLLGVVGIALAMFQGNPGDRGTGTRFLALLVFGIGAAPMCRWLLAQTRTGLPIFEIYMLFHAVAFGMAGFMPQESTLTAREPVTDSEWDAALAASALSMSAVAVGYYLWTFRFQRGGEPSPWPTRFDDSIMTRGWPLMLVALLLLKIGDGLWPREWVQVARSASAFLFAVVVVVCIRRQVSATVRALVLYVFVPFDAFVLSSLIRAALFGVFAVLMPVGLAYVACTKRVPVVLGALVLGTFLLLQPLKNDFRALVWSRADLTISDAVGMAAQVFEQDSPERVSGEGASAWLANSFSRLNHLHVTAAVIADTPSRLPHLYGETYVPLLSKLVPRFLWPEKPQENLGNAWAQRYGYLHERDFVTSFNLPVLTEMYINFGYAGLVAIGLAMGCLLGFLTLRVWGGAGESSRVAFGIAIAQPFMVPESNLSMLLGNLAVNGLVAYGILLLLAAMKPMPIVATGPRNGEIEGFPG